MSYTLGLILGSYTSCEFVWEIYLRLKEGGIPIRPNDELIPVGTSDSAARDIWINHHKTVTGTNFKGYFIIKENNVDKFKIYIGEIAGNANASYAYYRDAFYTTSNVGMPGALTGLSGRNGIVGYFKNDLLTNTLEMTPTSSTSLQHYPCVLITTMSGEDVAGFPLGWYGSDNTGCVKTEGQSSASYNAHNYSKFYNHTIKIISNKSVKIIEFSPSSRDQSLSGIIVVGYIKNVGLTWVTNSTSTNINIGDTTNNIQKSVNQGNLSGTHNFQYYPTFCLNPVQVYMHHSLPYKYNSQDEYTIEYSPQKVFVSGQYTTSTKKIFQIFTTIKDIYDCNNINSIARPGSRIIIDNTIYYVIENSIIPIGEVEE